MEFGIARNTSAPEKLVVKVANKLGRKERN